MMQQQPERQGQTNPILPITHGFAEPLTFAHQWVFPHRDTPSSDHQEEILPVEEVEEDSQEEVIQEEAAASQEDQEDLQRILKEDTRGTV